VRPGSLLAGEYPWRPERFRAAGVTAFVDLTVEGEEPPYVDLIDGWATHERFPVRDYSVPTVDGMAAILDALDAALEREVVYLHCLGGSGRTGTAIGCWLVRHGIGCDEALATIAALRRETAYGDKRSPESDEQCDFVRAWLR
jgi:hypothetical protein